eukprot:TRINITY_DN25992_c0_g1_i1.p1 TRINITY_DN25992_c0_g1~~TRINITY_DN25992_c0_g1_i1.p1  ORF type:complete len:583 (+),score=52.16 TRINITY_DN25992_c0_g1_i1:57-1751(+)
MWMHVFSVGLMYISCSCYLLLLVYQLCTTVWASRGILIECAASLGRCLTYLPKTTEQIQLETRVGDVVDAHKINRFLRVAKVIPVGPMVLMTRGIISHQSGDIDPDGFKLQYSYAWIIICSCVVQLFPEKIKMRSCFTMCFICHLLASIPLLTSTSLLEFANMLSPVAAMRVAQGPFLGSWRFNLSLALFWTCLVSPAWLFIIPYEESCQKTYVENLCQFPRVLLGEIVIGILSIAVGLVVDSSMYAEARATVDGKATRQFDAISKSMLNALCDAVVYLDSDLHISVPSPELASLLLHTSDDGASQVGRKFSEFLSEDNRYVLQQRRTSGSNMMADSFTASLVDSSGTRVHAQILRSHYFDLDDRLCHVLGIRELDMDQLPVNSFLPSAEGMVVIETINFTIKTAKKLLPSMRRGTDFRMYLSEPNCLARQVRRFCIDVCVDVFDEVEESRNTQESEDFTEFSVQQDIGVHDFEVYDKRARTSRKWTAHLTLESTRSLHQKKEIKICTSDLRPAAEIEEFASVLDAQHFYRSADPPGVEDSCMKVSSCGSDASSNPVLLGKVCL